MAHSPLPESSWWGQKDSCLPPLPHRLWESRNGAAPCSAPCPPCPGRVQGSHLSTQPSQGLSGWQARPWDQGSFPHGHGLLKATPQLPDPKSNNCGSRRHRADSGSQRGLPPPGTEDGFQRVLPVAPQGGPLHSQHEARAPSPLQEQLCLGPPGGDSRWGCPPSRNHRLAWRAISGQGAPADLSIQRPDTLGAAADPVHRALALVSQDGFVGTCGAFVWVPWSRSFSKVAEVAQGAVPCQRPLWIWAHGPLRAADPSLPLWGPRGCTLGRGAEQALLPVTRSGLCSCCELNAQ